LLFAGLYLVAVRTAWGQRVDATALEGQEQVHRPRVEDATERLLSTISIGSVALVGGAIVLVALARGRGRLALTAGVVIGGSTVSAEILKRIVLDRPVLIVPDERGVVASFPSGHTAVAMSLSLAAVLVAPRRLRGFVAVVGGGYALAIGEGVVLTGWHRPSDVLGSYLLCAAWAAIAAAGLVTTNARLVGTGDQVAGGRAVVSPVVAAVGAIALVVAFAGVAAIDVALRADRLDAIDLDAAYAAAAAAIFGLALVVMAGAVFLLRGMALDPPGVSDPAFTRQ
jgi:hypothetical protein